MARRPDAEELAGSRSSRRAAEEKRSAFDNFRWSRVVLWVFLGITALVGTLVGWHRSEEFLIRDDRFRLTEPPDFAGFSPSLLVEGVHYASPSQVRHVFAADFGRSLYLVPVNTRRKELMSIDWVEEATV